MYQVLWERYKCAAERIGIAYPALICSSVQGTTSCGLVNTFRRNLLPTALVQKIPKFSSGFTTQSDITTRKLLYTILSH
jgi:hypothetical protein